MGFLVMSDVLRVKEAEGEIGDKNLDSPEIQQLSQIYALVNPREIEKYINFNKYLVGFLINIPEGIESYFNGDPSKQLTLKFFSDPEISDREGLLVIVNTHLGIDESLECLDRFYEGWWVNFSKNVFPKVGVDVRII
jgi:hypothetical protein